MRRRFAVLFYLMENSRSVDMMEGKKVELTSELFLIKKISLQHVHHAGLNPSISKQNLEGNFQGFLPRSIYFSSAVCFILTF